MPSGSMRPGLPYARSFFSGIFFALGLYRDPRRHFKTAFEAVWRSGHCVHRQILTEADTA